jgi:hypothetical protein
MLAGLHLEARRQTMERTFFRLREFRSDPLFWVLCAVFLFGIIVALALSFTVKWKSADERAYLDLVKEEEELWQLGKDLQALAEEIQTVSGNQTGSDRITSMVVARL